MFQGPIADYSVQTSVSFIIKLKRYPKIVIVKMLRSLFKYIFIKITLLILVEPSSDEEDTRQRMLEIRGGYFNILSSLHDLSLIYQRRPEGREGERPVNIICVSLPHQR